MKAKANPAAHPADHRTRLGRGRFMCSDGIDRIAEEDGRIDGEEFGDHGQHQRRHHADTPARHLRRGQQAEQARHGRAKPAIGGFYGIVVGIGA